MLCHCGKRITRAPFLLDGKVGWWHIEENSFKCADGNWGAPSEELTFARVEKLIEGLRAMQTIPVEGGLVQ
jgi:hypothetical protein